MNTSYTWAAWQIMKILTQTRILGGACTYPSSTDDVAVHGCCWARAAATLSPSLPRAMWLMGRSGEPPYSPRSARLAGEAGLESGVSSVRLASMCQRTASEPPKSARVDPVDFDRISLKKTLLLRPHTQGACVRAHRSPRTAAHWDRVTATAGFAAGWESRCTMGCRKVENHQSGRCGCR